MVIEEISENEPQRILRSVGRRNVSGGIEEDRHVDKPHPAVGISPVQQIHKHRDNGANEKEVHQRAVNLAGLEHSLRADGAPDQAGVVVYLGPVTRESLRVVRGAEIRDVANHPAQHACLDRRREDGGVDLAHKEHAWRDLHVLAQLEVLCKVHPVLHTVVAKTLYHHVGDGLPGPSVAGYELGDDIEEPV